MRRLTRTGAGLLAALLALAATVNAQAGAGWSIVASPNPVAAQGQLTAVSCSAANACTAVGNLTTPSGLATIFAERWDGTAWAVQPVPPPAGAQSSVLNGVSCQTAVTCTAVGSFVGSTGMTATLAETWNGLSWSGQATPNPGGSRSSELNAIACASPAHCTAVGDFVASAGSELTLAEQWNGTSWAVQSTPNGLGASSSTLSGVSCALLTTCIAVGHFTTANGQRSLAESWNGTGWVLQTTPNPAGALSITLSAVSCSTAVACMAVGSYRKGTNDRTVTTLAEAWASPTWTIVPSAAPISAPTTILSGVSCTTPSACTAVGASTPYTNDGEVVIAQAWNGAAWNLESAPNAPGAIVSALAAVTCTASAACTAVGLSEIGSAPIVTLAEAWDGARWTAQATPNPQGAQISELRGIACPAAAVCIAVGTSIDNTNQSRTLAEGWNGTSWSVETTPNPPGTSNNFLDAVACPSVNRCVAVGDTQRHAADGSVTERTLAEQWNGFTWTIATSADPFGAQSNDLLGVACASVTACIAVGTTDGKPLAEAWNGTAWSVQAAAVPADAWGPVSLKSVSCTARNTCIAVGDYRGTSHVSVALAERWDGTAWTLQAPVQPATYWNDLFGVSCVSATSCTAVGEYTLENSARTAVPLAEWWNGAAWTVERAPGPAGAQGSGLGSVACAANGACSAVGSFTDSAGAFRTLVDVWNGTAWTPQPGPNPPRTLESVLNGVACTSNGACMAAGYYVNASMTTRLTLAERNS